MVDLGHLAPYQLQLLVHSHVLAACDRVSSRATAAAVRQKGERGRVSGLGTVVGELAAGNRWARRAVRDRLAECRSAVGLIRPRDLVQIPEYSITG